MKLMNKVFLCVVLCTGIVQLQGIGTFTLQERVAFAEAALERTLEHASLKDRMLAWFPGKRKEDTRAYEIQQLKNATWALRRELLQEHDASNFMILLNYYEDQLKVAATILGLGAATYMTVKGMRERGQKNKQERGLRMFEEIGAKNKIRGAVVKNKDTLLSKLKEKNAKREKASAPVAAV